MTSANTRGPVYLATAGDGYPIVKFWSVGAFRYFEIVEHLLNGELKFAGQGCHGIEPI
jgi:hypothetical protein